MEDGKMGRWEEDGKMGRWEEDGKMIFCKKGINFLVRFQIASSIQCLFCGFNAINVYLVSIKKPVVVITYISCVYAFLRCVFAFYYRKNAFWCHCGVLQCYYVYIYLRMAIYLRFTNEKTQKRISSFYVSQVAFYKRKNAKWVFFTHGQPMLLTAHASRSNILYLSQSYLSFSHVIEHNSTQLHFVYCFTGLCILTLSLQT